MDLLVEAPLNSLSFGNVSYNILRELYKKSVNVGLFVIGQADFSAYPFDKGFREWLAFSDFQKWKVLKSGAPSLKLWHLNGGENRKSPSQNLFTFYECSNPTETEVSIASSQNKIIFSSNYAKNLFENAGCSNTAYVPLGFDSDFFEVKSQKLNGTIHFGLIGKFEKRKNTAAIIKLWADKFGDDNRYQLSCCINNPFLTTEQMSNAINNALGGRRYKNINFLPHLKTNQEVNLLMNSIDIDLSGLSSSEGWGIPSFNATCLGKWSIVANHTAHKDWATNENSILVEPNGVVPSSDGVFFAEGQEYNQGNFFTWEKEEAIAAMELAVKKVGTVNSEGILLGKKLTYDNTVDQILKTF